MSRGCSHDNALQIALSLRPHVFFHPIDLLLAEDLFMKITSVQPIFSLYSAAAMALLLFAMFSSPALADNGWTCDKQDLVPLTAGPSGTSVLCLSPSGVAGKMKAEGLVPGNAYTLWLIYIDDPTVCDPTTLDCFDDADPEGVFGRFDSAVAPASGKIKFDGMVRDLIPSPGSLYMLMLYSHGPADHSDGRKLARELLTPEDPDAGAPHLGIAADGPGFSFAGVGVHPVY